MLLFLQIILSFKFPSLDFIIGEEASAIVNAVVFVIIEEPVGDLRCH
jgi:hypothetical protein